MQVRTRGFFILSGLCFLAAAAFGGDLLPLRRVETVSTNQQASAGTPVFRQSRAKEDFLHLQRDKAYGLPKAALSAGQVDTISILAIRVDFKYEDPDDPNTTGRGRFDLRDTAAFIQAEGHALDPAPHNSRYFLAHLRAMTHYWEVVSNGKLHFEYEVWPQPIDSAYHLDQTMAYYGSQDPNYGLAGLFHNAIQLAVSADSANLHFRDARGRKKAVILFHAGADQQTNLSFSATNTPYDLYTGFATFNAANWVYLPSDTVVEGVIMPETMSQDNRVTCMNAVMAHEFGHQLGLVDIYNTGSTPPLSEVGNFELMDNNASNIGAEFPNYSVTAFGTVPVFPSAWSRAYLGFDEVVEYTSGTNIEVAAVKMRTDKTKIVKVPISSTEYYLLENRRSDVDGEVQGLQQDSATNVILGPVKLDLLDDSLSLLLNNASGNLRAGGVLGVGASPTAVIATDLNHDGHSDLVVANSLSNEISVIVADGAGGFLQPVNFAVDQTPSSICAARLDTSGGIDLVVANAGSDDISILYADTADMLKPAVNISVHNKPSSVCAADFNGDGLNDIAVANAGSNTISILINTGNGGFQPALNYAVGRKPSSLYSADFNGDGRADLVVANAGSDSVSVLLNQNQADGAFSPAQNYSAGKTPSAVCAIKVNSDDYYDLAVADAGSDSVTILLNAGDGTFHVDAAYSAGSYPSAIVCADINNDNCSDLIITDIAADSVTVLRNDCDGHFVSMAGYAVGRRPSSIAAADFNNDGFMDLVVANMGDKFVQLPEYDLYLPPGSAGIAIWHVDEMAATMNYDPYSGFTNNFDANDLQWDRFRRFLSIEEADGLIEFGGNYQSGTGVKKDLFYAGNNAQFSDFTNPAAISNDHGYTHIKISNISAPDSIMTFDVSREQMADGFPRRMAIPTNPNLPPVAVRLNSSGNLDSAGSEVIFAVSRNKILAMRTDGRDFLDTLGAYPDNDTMSDVIRASTAVNSDRPLDTALAPMPVFAKEDIVGQISAPLIVAQFQKDTTIVLVGTSAGIVYSFLPYANTSGLPGLYRARLFHFMAAAGAGAVRQIVPDYANSVIRVIYADGEIVSTAWDTTAVFFSTDSTNRRSFGGTAVGACRYKHGLAYLTESDTGSILYQLRDVSPAQIKDSLVAASLFIPETGFHLPVATDFDRDGVDEIALLSRHGHILAYRFSETGISAYAPLDIHTGDTAAAGPAIADFTGSGYPDLIVPGTNHIYAYAWNGLPANDFPLSIDNAYPGQFVITTPLVTDIDGDGRPDIVVATFDSLTHPRSIAVRIIDTTVVPPDTTDTSLTYDYYNYFSRIYALSPDQFRVAGSPYEAGAFGIHRLGDTVVGVATPLHLKSGAGGLLVTMGADGWLNAWKCGWNADKAEWPMARRTPDGSGYFPLDSLGPEKPLADFLPKARFFGYPNPAVGDKTTIRFYLSQPASVTLTVFDALGDKVWEKSLDILAGNQDNDVVWDVHDIASGVYHCRIKAVARSGGQEAVVIKPIAVVK